MKRCNDSQKDQSDPKEAVASGMCAATELLAICSRHCARHCCGKQSSSMIAFQKHTWGCQALPPPVPYSDKIVYIIQLSGQSLGIIENSKGSHLWTALEVSAIQSSVCGLLYRLISQDRQTLTVEREVDSTLLKASFSTRLLPVTGTLCRSSCSTSILRS